GQRRAAALADRRGGRGQLLAGARRQRHAGGFAPPRERDRGADPPAGAGPERHPTPRGAPPRAQNLSPPPRLISSLNPAGPPRPAWITPMTPARVSGPPRNVPSIAEVIPFDFCFSPPRISMHRWIPSIPTATPRGWSASFSVLAIWVVSRS